MVAKGASGVWPLPLLSPALLLVDWTKKTLLGAKRASLKTSGPTPPSVRVCRKGERVLGTGGVSAKGRVRPAVNGRPTQTSRVNPAPQRHCLLGGSVFSPVHRACFW